MKGPRAISDLNQGYGGNFIIKASTDQRNILNSGERGIRRPGDPAPKSRRGMRFRFSPDFPWINSFDLGNEVEMVVGGNDLLDAVIDHGGGVDGVAGSDLRMVF